jgi:hypothetical protein
MMEMHSPGISFAVPVPPCLNFSQLLRVYSGLSRTVPPQIYHSSRWLMDAKTVYIKSEYAAKAMVFEVYRY